jgi:hypothetical protein
MEKGSQEDQQQEEPLTTIINHGLANCRLPLPHSLCMSVAPQGAISPAPKSELKEQEGSRNLEVTDSIGGQSSITEERKDIVECQASMSAGLANCKLPLPSSLVITVDISSSISLPASVRGDVLIVEVQDAVDVAKNIQEVEVLPTAWAGEEPENAIEIPPMAGKAPQRGTPKGQNIHPTATNGQDCRKNAPGKSSSLTMISLGAAVAAVSCIALVVLTKRGL